MLPSKIKDHVEKYVWARSILSILSLLLSNVTWKDDYRDARRYKVNSKGSI